MTGGTAAAAAFLAACGSDDGGTTSPTAGTGTTGAAATGATGGGAELLVPATDSTGEMVRGGSGTWAHPTPVSLDPHLTGGQVAHGWHAYSQLFRIQEGYLQRASGEFEGELVDRWEFSGDQLQLILHLKEGVLFADKAPVNARAVDAHDVVYSWSRYEGLSPRRRELSNQHNPAAPVLSMEAADDMTVLVNLQEPNATILGGFAGNLPGTPYIVPREVEDGIDLRFEAIGTGPFQLAEYEPGFSARYIRNPGFRNVDDRDLPFLDEVIYLEVPDYPAFLAQFKAGQLINQFAGVLADDVLQTKADMPVLEMYDNGLSRGQTRAIFGHLEDSPFRDERVRQAVTRVWDRDLFTEVAFGTRQFEEAGIPIDMPWDAAIPAGSPSAYDGWWLDPQSADFGPTAVSYHYDVAEAQALLSAAGFENGVDVLFTYSDGYATTFLNRREILEGMMETSGLFRVTTNVVDFNTEWNPVWNVNRGEFSGMAMHLDTNELDPAVDLHSHYNSAGSRYFGGDEELDRLTDAMLREFDLDARKQLAHELQRYEGRVQWRPAITSATSIRIAWPAERNRRVWRGSENRWNAHIWLDRTKPPFV